MRLDFRFRTRALLVCFAIAVFLVIGLSVYRTALCGYDEYQAEQFALRQLNSEGGWIIAYRPDEMPVMSFSDLGHSLFIDQRWCGPSWLRPILRKSGAPIFDRTIAIDVSDTTFDQNDIEALMHLKELEHVTFDHRDASPDTMRNAQELLPHVTFATRQLGEPAPKLVELPK
jgi:hypothetical protein